MPINSAAAVKFSNERVRPSADLLARAYYRCDAARDRWDGLGGGQTAVDQMASQIRLAADSLIALYEWSFRTEKLWFQKGGTAFIPNNSEQVWDNSDRTGQDPGRPPITGEKVVRIIDRIVQLQNWLLSAAGLFDDATRINVAYYNTVLAVSSDGASPMAVADAGNFMNRCGELRARYEANSNQELGFILAVAVNPNP